MGYESHSHSQNVTLPCCLAIVTSFKSAAQVTTSLPEKQHYGKRLVERRCERHTQLDGALQVLLSYVEAMVVDLAAPENVLTFRALMENG